LAHIYVYVYILEIFLSQVITTLSISIVRVLD